MASRAVFGVRLHLLRRFRFETCSCFTGSDRGLAGSRMRWAASLARLSSCRTRSCSAKYPFFLVTGASILFAGEILEPLEDIGAPRRLRFPLLAGNLRGRLLRSAFFLQLFLSRTGRPALAHRLERIPPHRKRPRLLFLFFPFGLLRRAGLALLFELSLALAPFEQPPRQR